MMFKSLRNRMSLALILVVSHIALSAHSFEIHNPAEFTQCELCVAQDKDEGDILHVDSDIPESSNYHVAATSVFAPALSTQHYPAWTQRAPPLFN